MYDSTAVRADSDFAFAALPRPAWYVVHTRSNFEKVVSAELSGKGFETYLPAFREEAEWSDRRKFVDRLPFPGYVFTRFCDNNPTRVQILRSPGTVQILGVGERIEAVPDEEVESIRRMLASSRCFPHPFLREGARVRVVRGALTGVEGILARFKNRSRIVVSASLLSQSVAAEIDRRDVEPLR